MHTRLTEMFGIEVPIVLAPMAGSGGVDLAVEVARAGGLGSLPCALLDATQVRVATAQFRAATEGPLNLNFFCHAEPSLDADVAARWALRLAPYYDELGIDTDAPAGGGRLTFGDAMCRVIEDVKPEVVSFHFGLPPAELVERVRSTGARVMSSATTVAEAVWLEANGCDVVIAQGSEAGGHRGVFASDDISTQIGTMALVPLVVDAVSVPVVAAGGIGDGRAVAAALVLGAEAVQVGTAFLLTPEATTTELHRRALAEPTLVDTALTNVFTGRPARSLVNRLVGEIGPMSADAPGFPLAAGAVAPLRAAAEQRGSNDFTPLWSGQAGARRAIPARELTMELMARAEQLLGRPNE